MPTDLEICLPAGHCAILCPRSGLAKSSSVICLSGLIDRDYTGNLTVLLHNMSSEPYQVRRGDRIAQLLCLPTPLRIPVVEMDAGKKRLTARGEGGFGSTGEAMELDGDDAASLAGSEARRAAFWKSNSYNICVEGSIAAGKSTLLSYIQSRIAENEMSDIVHCVTEPVGRWTDFEGINYLKLLYEDKEKEALSFQLIALITQLEQRRDCSQNCKIFIAERCPQSGVSVFGATILSPGQETALRAVYRNVRDRSLALDEPFDWDMYIYLRTSPSVVYDRLKKRGRGEEKEISLDYLSALHTNYEKWISHLSTIPGVLVICLDGDEKEEALREKFDLIWKTTILAKLHKAAA